MSDEILRITISETPLGKRWVLKIGGIDHKGGYATDVWNAMDQASEALLRTAEQTKRLVEGER